LRRSVRAGIIKRISKRTDGKFLPIHRLHALCQE